MGRLFPLFCDLSRPPRGEHWARFGAVRDKNGEHDLSRFVEVNKGSTGWTACIIGFRLEWLEPYALMPETRTLVVTRPVRQQALNDLYELMAKDPRQQVIRRCPHTPLQPRLAMCMADEMLVRRRPV